MKKFLYIILTIFITFNHSFSDDLVVAISEGNKNAKINFVNMDMDTYPTTKFVLKNIKPYLVDGAIIIFDELYNFPGWKISEYKALTEEFNENEYKFLAFSTDGQQAVIQYNKN